MISAMPLIFNPPRFPGRYARYKSAAKPCGLAHVRSRDTYLRRRRIQVETLHVDSSSYLRPLAVPAIAALSSLAPRVFHLCDRGSVPPGIPDLDSLPAAVPAASRCTVHRSHTKAAAPKSNLSLPPLPTDGSNRIPAEPAVLAVRL